MCACLLSLYPNFGCPCDSFTQWSCLLLSSHNFMAISFTTVFFHFVHVTVPMPCCLSDFALKGPCLPIVQPPIFVTLFVSFLFFSDSSSHSKETSSIEPGSETALQSGGSATPPPTFSMVELFNQRRQKLMQRKFHIAELSSSILENPQENVS